jgi:2-amino-4-hydroxy-6-hydroxymethyldihydropteridine diphosphokinase
MEVKKNKSQSVYLLLGSNLENRVEKLNEAIIGLSKIGLTMVTKSSLYQTKAWGLETQPDFINQVIEVQTSLNPTECLHAILQLEQSMGRQREIHWGPRTIDIDILLYGNEIVVQPNLVIPHREIANRRFTLVPLAELASDLMHPVLNKNIRTLLLECPDKLEVTKLED